MSTELKAHVLSEYPVLVSAPSLYTGSSVGNEFLSQKSTFLVTYPDTLHLSTERDYSENAPPQLLAQSVGEQKLQAKSASVLMR